MARRFTTDSTVATIVQDLAAFLALMFFMAFLWIGVGIIADWQAAQRADAVAVRYVSRGR